MWIGDDMETEEGSPTCSNVYDFTMRLCPSGPSSIDDPPYSTLDDQDNSWVDEFIRHEDDSSTVATPDFTTTATISSSDVPARIPGQSRPDGLSVTQPSPDCSTANSGGIAAYGSDNTLSHLDASLHDLSIAKSQVKLARRIRSKQCQMANRKELEELRSIPESSRTEADRAKIKKLRQRLNQARYASGQSVPRNAKSMQQTKPCLEDNSALMSEGTRFSYTSQPHHQGQGTVDEQNQVPPDSALAGTDN
ncbi:uncharacterized protein I303_107736 [Kwoniella dejecticola CBS 10117]|uniref:Uncharacterized protein n=1 Tax=Kwoniella dejecticola CBS 10117 TaxID=1296121 RepID=A0A1A5ZVJ6_9TREE|nr:uncharacterized protein I303_07741 [Kwoniella dejecticola CBS 10117]OBR81831.1 hypothetical protein I303_07741 [Kwoniella dejecticola CBS 10117]